ncbi:MAG: DUF2480 family protein [Flavobacteriaceae bacterium]
MADTIINRVAQSALIQLDLEAFYPSGKRTLLDIAQWLEEGFLLREKEFRAQLKAHNWNQYQDHFVALNCSTQAIVPAWATLLITTYLTPVAQKIVEGDLSQLENALYADWMATFDWSSFKDKPVMIKGCAEKPIPENVLVQVVQKLQPLAKSLFYGEACSSVPLWKK